MIQCPACSGFIPAAQAQCPNCEIAPCEGLAVESTSPSVSKRLKRSVQWILGASLSMTLSACYGAPPPLPNTDCPPNPDGTEQPCDNATPPSDESPSDPA